ncbi:hypothetical protein RhiirA5_441252 [Rhizophagus irregularis]|uniref:Uncharacterized protein n=1 Tax=Rhizophagus irregularis TaxID=588596 RepID=A0A2N0NFT5_9GLOM|nr:hypothetical protein RhiirA5_441252 [Rhizophagus irregularis]
MGRKNEGEKGGERNGKGERKRKGENEMGRENEREKGKETKWEWERLNFFRYTAAGAASAAPAAVIISNIM